MFVIAGVTGNTGNVVASTLLAANAKVRVIVRDAAKGEAWKARGAEVAVLALADTAKLTAALTGATGAYLLLPPDLGSPAPIAEHRALATAIAAAVGAAKVPHVALLSSVGAQHADGTGPIVALHHGERLLGEVTTLTAVRAASFMENWISSLGALAHGVLPTFVPAGLAYPQVATADIGRTAAAALLEGARGRQVIELSGPREYAATDIAAALATLTGKPVAVSEGPLEAVVPTLTGFGMSAPVAELFREMYAGLLSGRIGFAGGDTRRVRGTVSIEDVLRPHLPH